MAAVATYAPFLGLWVEQFEAASWAEELIEPARAVDHPRLAALYGLASQCYTTGRVEAAVRYTDAAQRVTGSRRDDVPYGIQSWLGAAYVYIGQPERAVEWCRTQLQGSPDTLLTRIALVLALTIAGSPEEAMAAAHGLIEDAEATRNPWMLSYALLAYGTAFRDADPDRALDALRRGLVIAQDSGNRYTESDLAITLARLEAKHGDPLAALDYFTVAIRNYHDSGSTTTIRSPLANLAAFLDRLGCYEQAATIAGFAFSPLSSSWVPKIHTTIANLRDVLGDQTYESLARKGATMNTAAMSTYAYDQIDQARTELNAVS